MYTKTALTFLEYSRVTTHFKAYKSCESSYFFHIFNGSKDIDEKVRFSSIFAKNELFSHVYVYIFWTVEDMGKPRQYATFRIW